MQVGRPSNDAKNQRKLQRHVQLVEAGELLAACPPLPPTQPSWWRPDSGLRVREGPATVFAVERQTRVAEGMKRVSSSGRSLQGWSRAALARLLATVLTEDNAHQWQKSVKKHNDAALDKKVLPTRWLMEFQRCMGVLCEAGIACAAVARALLRRLLEAICEKRVAGKLAVRLSYTRQPLRQFGFRNRTASTGTRLEPTV